jgi:hypothetical protein
MRKVKNITARVTPDIHGQTRDLNILRLRKGGIV